MCVEEQLRKDIDACECFPLQSDEMTDMVDVEQSYVFIRIGFKDTSTKEELLTILPLKGHNRYEIEDIFDAFVVGLVNEKQNAAIQLVLVTLTPKLSPSPAQKAPVLRTRSWHCKMTLRSKRHKPHKYPLILENIEFSGNYGGVEVS